jgi:hypothetical protein
MYPDFNLLVVLALIVFGTVHFFVGMHAQREYVLIITCHATKECFDFLHFVTLNSLCYVRLCHDN